MFRMRGLGIELSISDNVEDEYCNLRYAESDAEDYRAIYSVVAVLTTKALWILPRLSKDNEARASHVRLFGGRIKILRSRGINRMQT
jgi:hypothetical protein